MAQMVENNAALGNAWHIQNCLAFDSAALSQSRGPDKCLSMGATSVLCYSMGVTSECYSMGVTSVLCYSMPSC